MFISNKVRVYITLWVIVVHILLLIFIEKITKKKEHIEKLVVTEIIVQPQKQPKVQPRKIVKKKAVPSKKIISKNLMQHLQDSISKLDENMSRSTLRGNLDVPIPIAALSIDAKISFEKKNIPLKYRDLLIDSLKSNLNLPDYGEVKVKLKIRGDGKVMEVKILDFQSEKNRKYLVDNLPKLSFSYFHHYFAKNEECCFIINFKNEKNF